MTTIAKRIGLPGIPIWVSCYANLLAVVGVALGIRGLLDATTAGNYVEGANAMAGAWAGRTLGLGLATGVAVLLRSNAALSVAFLGPFFREFGDIVGTPTGIGGTVGVLVGPETQQAPQN